MPGSPNQRAPHVHEPGCCDASELDAVHSAPAIEAYREWARAEDVTVGRPFDAARDQPVIDEIIARQRAELVELVAAAAPGPPPALREGDEVGIDLPGARAGRWRVVSVADEPDGGQTLHLERLT